MPDLNSVSISIDSWKSESNQEKEPSLNILDIDVQKNDKKIEELWIRNLYLVPQQPPCEESIYQLKQSA